MKNLLYLILDVILSAFAGAGLVFALFMIVVNTVIFVYNGYVPEDMCAAGLMGMCVLATWGYMYRKSYNIFKS